MRACVHPCVPPIVCASGIVGWLRFLSKAALNFILAMNGRLGQQAHQSDWYQGQQLLEGLLEMLYDKGVKCNVIVTSHITYIGDEQNPEVGYPSTLGKALPPKVGRYFNTTLMVKTKGVGSSAQKVIYTSSIGKVELKNSAPTAVAKEYPLATGLADYFRAVRQAGPQAQP